MNWSCVFCSGQKARLAILSHDPSVIGEGALLGDRATMINSQNDRVFMRSMATRGQAGGFRPRPKVFTPCWRFGFRLRYYRDGRNRPGSVPFRSKLIDQTVLVMNPDYGARLQLQKIVMLDVADIVVVNKTDLERAKAALSEIEQRFTQNQRDQRIVATVAKRHRDHGVDEFYEIITRVDSGWGGGQRPSEDTEWPNDREKAANGTKHESGRQR